MIPNNYKVNGIVNWNGEESDDKGKIIIENNNIEIYILDNNY